MTLEISDTYLAGYLMACGIPLASNRREAGTTIFCFAQSDRLNQLVEGYFDMTATVIPLQYGSALKILKNIIYQKENNYNDNQRMFHQQRRAQ